MKKVIITLSLSVGMLIAANNTNTGCGLGSTLIENQDTTISQLAATFLNGTSGNQTFGITSGTSNCDKPSSFVSNDKLHKFVNDNMDSIAMDISKGQGENLTTLASMMGVKDKALFSKKLQSNFDKIYLSENTTSSQVIDNIAKYI